MCSHFLLTTSFICLVYICTSDGNYNLFHFLIAVPVGQTSVVITTLKESDAVLYCNISGHGLKYSWFIGDIPVINSTNRYLVKDNMLTIYNAQFSDIGNYTCRAENIAGNHLQVHQVQILGMLLIIWHTKLLFKNLNILGQTNQI